MADGRTVAVMNVLNAGARMPRTTTMAERRCGRSSSAAQALGCTAEAGAGGLTNVLASFGADLPAVIHAPQTKAGRTATVGDARLEAGAGVENPAEDEGGHDQRVFHDDSDAVGQGVAVRSFEQQIVLRLGMQEQRAAHGLDGLAGRTEPSLDPAGAVHLRRALR